MEKSGVQKDFDMLVKELEGFYYTYTEFFEMIKLVSSRVLEVNIDGKSTLALCPYADMFNHSRTPNCKWTYNSQ